MSRSHRALILRCYKLGAVTAKTLGLWLTLLCASTHLRARQGVPPGGPGPALPVPRTGEDIYRAACVTCHGADGRGSPKVHCWFRCAPSRFHGLRLCQRRARSRLERGRTRRRTRPRAGSAHARVRRRALAEDIALAVGHLRTFCTDTAWPRGDLNLPRAFFTEKAFPENEAVWATTFTGSGPRSVANTLIYERRIGARNQIELVVTPISLQQDAGGEWPAAGSANRACVQAHCLRGPADRRHRRRGRGSHSADRQGAARAR